MKSGILKYSVLTCVLSLCLGSTALAQKVPAFSDSMCKDLAKRVLQLTFACMAGDQAACEELLAAEVLLQLCDVQPQVILGCTFGDGQGYHDFCLQPENNPVITEAVCSDCVLFCLDMCRQNCASDATSEAVCAMGCAQGGLECLQCIPNLANIC